MYESLEWGNWVDIGAQECSEPQLNSAQGSTQLSVSSLCLWLLVCFAWLQSLQLAINQSINQNNLITGDKEMFKLGD